MKTINTIIFLLFVLLIASCVKVIDIELEDTEARLVIEAELILGSTNFEVTISKTRPYFEAGQIEFVSNATAKIIDQSGNETLLSFSGNGVYSAPYSPQVNGSYTLVVTVDGQTYTASSTMPESLPISGLFSEYQQGFGPLNEGYSVLVSFNDPGGVENFFRISHTLNGTKQILGSDITVDNDQLFDGNTVMYPLASRKTFSLGDTIDVRLLHIDQATHDYFSSLQDIVGGGAGPGASAAPGNPITNWDNGALGYFSAANVDEGTIIIQ